MSNDKLKSFIQGLDDINKDNLINIKIPSLGKNCKFKLISVAQHKELLKSAFEGYEGVIKSNIIFNDIITNNCEKEDVDFSLIDRSTILIKLREASISDNISIGKNQYKLSSLPVVEGLFESNTITCNGITIETCIPSLERDTEVSKKLLNDFTRLSDKEKETNGINLVLSYEIIKFIKSISIGDDVFEFNDSNLYESKKIIDSLPLKLNNKVINFITKFRDFENEFLTFEDGTLLEIDVSFLSSE